LGDLAEDDPCGLAEELVEVHSFAVVVGAAVSGHSSNENCAAALHSIINKPYKKQEDKRAERGHQLERSDRGIYNSDSGKNQKQGIKVGDGSKLTLILAQFSMKLSFLQQYAYLHLSVCWLWLK
jgi:hypothetical protein